MMPPLRCSHSNLSPSALAGGAGKYEFIVRFSGMELSLQSLDWLEYRKVGFLMLDTRDCAIPVKSRTGDGDENLFGQMRGCRLQQCGEGDCRSCHFG